MQQNDACSPVVVLRPVFLYLGIAFHTRTHVAEHCLVEIKVHAEKEGVMHLIENLRVYLPPETLIGRGLITLLCISAVFITDSPVIVGHVLEPQIEINPEPVFEPVRLPQRIGRDGTRGTVPGHYIEVGTVEVFIVGICGEGEQPARRQQEAHFRSISGYDKGRCAKISLFNAVGISCLVGKSNDSRKYCCGHQQ